jgi:hypothetical protein
VQQLLSEVLGDAKVYIYIYIYIHIYICIYINIYIYTDIYVYIYIYICIYTYIKDLEEQLCVVLKGEDISYEEYEQLSLKVGIYNVYSCTDVYIYLYIFIYIYTSRDRDSYTYLYVHICMHMHMYNSDIYTCLRVIFLLFLLKRKKLPYFLSIPLSNL